MNLAAIENVALPVLNRHGCNLVHCTFHRETDGWVLRLLIERQCDDSRDISGIDHRLCSSISRDVEAALDVQDIINRPYTLEVSSPGLERPLVRAEDFDRFSGKQVSIKIKKAMEGRRQFKGILQGMGDGAVFVKTKDGKIITLPGDLIEKANLIFEPKDFMAGTGD